MNRKVSLFTGAVVAILSIGCSNKILVSYDYDKDINFSKYSSYNFTSESNESSLDQLTKKRIFVSISEVMNKKDFSWEEQPDVFVHFHVNLIKDKKQSKEATTPMHKAESYKIGDNYIGSYIDTGEYARGTLFIDLIDAKSNRLIWKSIGKVEIDTERKNPDKDMRKLVKKMFRSFPPK